MKNRLSFNKVYYTPLNHRNKFTGSYKKSRQSLRKRMPAFIYLNKLYFLLVY